MPWLITNAFALFKYCTCLFLAAEGSLLYYHYFFLTESTTAQSVTLPWIALIAITIIIVQRQRRSRRPVSPRRYTVNSTGSKRFCHRERERGSICGLHGFGLIGVTSLRLAARTYSSACSKNGIGGGWSVAAMPRLMTWMPGRTDVPRRRAGN
jgi:hypothetical protein